MRRVLLALAYSAILNGILFAVALAAALRYPSSMVMRFVTLLLNPPTQLAEKIVPPGHDLWYVASGFVVSMSLSILLYAVPAWVLMTVLAWSRHSGREPGALA